MRVSTCEKEQLIQAMQAKEEDIIYRIENQLLINVCLYQHLLYYKTRRALQRACDVTLAIVNEK